MEKALTLREPLTRERIIEAALHIIDGQGLGRLTMRRLGDALQVEAMAIYHHLPRGKEELLDGLIAHVAAMPAAWPGSANGAKAAGSKGPGLGPDAGAGGVTGSAQTR